MADESDPRILTRPPSPPADPPPLSSAERDALNAERSRKLRKLWDTEREIKRLLATLPRLRDEVSRLDDLLADYDDHR